MDEFLSSLLAEHEANAERTALLINGPISELAERSSRTDEDAPFSEDFKETLNKASFAAFADDLLFKDADGYHNYRDCRDPGCVFYQRFELK